MNEHTQLLYLINPHLYFAYGSNLDPDQMDWRCPDAIALERIIAGARAFELPESWIDELVAAG